MLAQATPVVFERICIHDLNLPELNQALCICRVELINKARFQIAAIIVIFGIEGNFAAPSRFYSLCVLVK